MSENVAGPVAGTAHDQRQALTPTECAALRLLAAAGWTHAELRMVFELDHPGPHARGECEHRMDRVSCGALTEGGE